LIHFYKRLEITAATLYIGCTVFRALSTDKQRGHSLEVSQGMP